MQVSLDFDVVCIQKDTKQCCDATNLIVFNVRVVDQNFELYRACDVTSLFGIAITLKSLTFPIFLQAARS